MRSPVPLVNQATFVQIAYLSLVWLWESVKKDEDQQDAVLEDVGTRFNHGDVGWVGERKKDGIGSVLRLVRNALAHGRVTLDGQSFVFEDQDKRAREKAPTAATLSWEQVARLSEAVIFALSGVLYTGHR